MPDGLPGVRGSSSRPILAVDAANDPALEDVRGRRLPNLGSGRSLSPPVR